MTLKEQFDLLLQDVETPAATGEPEIAEALSKKYGSDLHTLADAFQVLTGKPLMQVIRDRRMATDQAPPLTFEAVCHGPCAEPGLHLHPSAADRRNSIPHHQFALMKQAIELADLYGFSDEETELVLHLAQDCGMSLSKAAAFYDEFRRQAGPDAGSGQIGIYEICSLACKQNLSFTQAQAVLLEIDADGYKSINDLPDGFFDLWLSDYNQNVCRMEVVTICSILEEMERQNISLLQLNDMIDTAEFSSTDLYDVVANYGEANSLFNNQEEEDNRELLEFLDPELAEFLGTTSTEDDDPFTIKR